jgi:hypothetical protein
MTITQYEIRYKTKVSHKHMVVIYHRNTPLPKVRTGLDGYKLRARGRRRQGKALCATLHGRMCIYTQDVARGLRVVKHANT